MNHTSPPVAAKDLLQPHPRELLPRTTLLTPNRREAAALLGVAPLQSRACVEQAARALQALGHDAVVITGDEEGDAPCEDYVATRLASGWLSSPRVDTPHRHATERVFASSAAGAMALGFVDIEAVVLAKMAATHALRHGRATGGFAQCFENVPHFSMPGHDPQRKAEAFAALDNPRLGLYAIVDNAAWVQRVLDAGVRTVQLRIKEQAPHLRQEVRASIAAARAANAQLFINDHWQLAVEEGAYGVHLGQEDLATADLGAMARAGLRLGLSTHSYWEVCRALHCKPSYIACGPIHRTKAKAMPWLPQGNDNLAYWCQLLPLPVVAIAGMDNERATQAAQCGAAGVAVIGAVTAAPSPETAIMELQQAIHAGQQLPRWPAPTLAQPTLKPAAGSSPRHGE